MARDDKVMGESLLFTRQKDEDNPPVRQKDHWLNHYGIIFLFINKEKELHRWIQEVTDCLQSSKSNPIYIGQDIQVIIV